MKKFPDIVSVFPLSNFIMFPNTTVPLNIFEPRYIDMINDSMKAERLIGMIQPNYKDDKKNMKPDLYQVGCLGKIINFQETKNGNFLIELKGLTRFKILEEIKTNNKYRSFKVNFDEFHADLNNSKENIKFSDLELIFKDLKSLFEKKGFIINWKALEKQSLDETINALAMASPFSLEEKQVLLEAKNLDLRKDRISDILSTYSHDIFENTTLQ